MLAHTREYHYHSSSSSNISNIFISKSSPSSSTRLFPQYQLVRPAEVGDSAPLGVPVVEPVTQVVAIAVRARLQEAPRYRRSL